MIVKAIDATIASVNSAFEEKTGMNSNQLIFGSLENITDQALKLNVRALLEQSRQTPDRLASHPLELQGQRHDITVQAVFGHDAIAYFIVVILPAAEEGGHAA
jgi:predicted naringenin-chalcone synthase